MSGKEHSAAASFSTAFRLTASAVILWRPLPHDHEMAGYVGAIASSWGHFERAIEDCIQQLGEQVDHRQPIDKKLNKLIELGAAQLSTALVEEIKAFAESVDKEPRHRAVHDPWFLHESGAAAQLPPGETEKVFREPAEFEARLTSIRALYVRASSFFERIRAELKS